MGLCLANCGDRKRALTAVQTAAQLDPQNASIQAHLQRLEGETDAERKKAVATLKDAVARYPTHERLALELAEAHWDAHEFEQAAAAFRKCIELNPKNVVPRAKLGAMLLQNNDLAGAVTELKAAVELDPKHVPGQIFLAKALYQKGDLPEALAVVKKGLAISPNHPQGLDMLARCLEATGDVPGAIDVYRQALAADKNNANLLFSLGMLPGRKNDFRGAAIEFAKAAEIEPKNSDALLALAGARTAPGALLLTQQTA